MLAGRIHTYPIHAQNHSFARWLCQVGCIRPRMKAGGPQNASGPHPHYPMKALNHPDCEAHWLCQVGSSLPRTSSGHSRNAGGPHRYFPIDTLNYPDSVVHELCQVGHTRHAASNKGRAFSECWRAKSTLSDRHSKSPRLFST